MSKIKFHVVLCSGEDPEYPADELNTHSPHTKGWQSPRFCDYPQELGFEMEHRSQLTRIQILSHQSKIASKVELFIGDGPNYDQARFDRLGYLSLNNNQRSNYQARELKSVYISCAGKFLRILLHRCYVNKYNLFNQVGIIAVNLMGSPAGPGDGGGGNGEVNRVTNGAPVLPALKPKTTAMDDISFDMNFDPETARRIREIAAAKEHAVNVEDYDTAKRLKGAEQELRTIGGQIAELEVAKRQAVAIEDYDRAKTLKQEIDMLRKEIDAKLQPYMDASPVAHDYRPVGPANVPDMTDRDEKPVPTHTRKPSLPVPAAMSALQRTMSLENGDDEGGGLEEGPYEGEAAVPARSRSISDLLLDDAARPRSREIKAVGYMDGEQQDPSLKEDGQDGGRPSKPAWQGEGPHPLEGIPNYEDLPAPEPQGKVAGVEQTELQALVNLFGEYVVRCLLSKTWTLRDAAIYKVKMLLLELNIQDALPSLVIVLRLGVDDKIAQVFITALTLLESTLDASRAAGIRRQQAGPLFEPVVNLLTQKLGDGQARIREAALTALTTAARSPTVGPAVVSMHALRKLPKRQATAWRPLHARLQLLKVLVESHGLASGSGMTASSVMGFAKEHGAFGHSSAEVREATRDLTVALYECIGPKVMKYIEPILRKKQIEEYEDAFQRATPGTDNGGEEDSVAEQASTVSHSHDEESLATPRMRSPSNGSMTTARTDAGAKSTPGKKGAGGANGTIAAATAKIRSPRSPVHSPVRNASDVEESADLDETADQTCQFCGKFDTSFNEDALDMHYFTQCPVLMRCRECGQVIEIICLGEHMLTECDARDQYEECPISGLAVKKADMNAWKDSPDCRPKPTAPNISRCPLCYADIKPNTEEGLKLHFTRKCPDNPRKVSPWSSAAGEKMHAAGRR